MATLSLDLLVPLAFVAALILLERFRPELQGEHREAFRCVASGVSVLAITALLKLYFRFGYLSALPFLSEPLFHRMLVWVGMILGTVCVASGMSQWLQQRRTKRLNDSDRIRRLETIRKLVQLVNVESRPDKMLDVALGYVIDGFQFRSGAMYRYSSRRAALCLTAVRPPEPASPLPERVPLRIDQELDAAALADQLEFAATKPSCVMPIVAGKRLAALLVLWRDDMHAPESVDQDLRIAVDILARSFEHALETARSRFIVKRDTWRCDLETTATGADGIKRGLTKLTVLLRQMIPCEAVVVTMVNQRTGQMRRYTWGIGENPLIEKGNAGFAWSSVQHVLRTGARVVATPQDRPDTASYALREIQSELHVPIITRRHSGAVLSLLSSQREAFGQMHIHLAEIAAPVYREFMRNQFHRRLRLRLREQRVQMDLLRERPRGPITRAAIIRDLAKPGRRFAGERNDKTSIEPTGAKLHQGVTP